MLCVMLVGGIDISIMPTLALSGMSIGMLLKYEHISSTFLAFVIAIAIGIVCGAVVGPDHFQSRCSPIIATMGFMYIYRALVIRYPTVEEWAVQQHLATSRILQQQKFLGLNAVIWVIIVCYVFFLLVYEMDQNRTYDLCSR